MYVRVLVSEKFSFQSEYFKKIATLDVLLGHFFKKIHFLSIDHLIYREEYKILCKYVESQRCTLSRFESN